MLRKTLGFQTSICILSFCMNVSRRAETVHNSLRLRGSARRGLGKGLGARPAKEKKGLETTERLEGIMNEKRRLDALDSEERSRIKMR